MTQLPLVGVLSCNNYGSTKHGESYALRCQHELSHLMTYYQHLLSRQSPLKQTVATSPTEAEYMTAAAGVREALRIKILCADLGLRVRHMLMCCDHQACIKIVKNAISSSKSKHIDA
jgi:hypothetical protein